MLSKKEVKQGKYSEMGMEGRKKWRGNINEFKNKKCIFINLCSQIGSDVTFAALHHYLY